MKTAASTLITAATPILARHGYAGTSMRDVAEAAGMKPSLIYHYFSDKAELLRAVRLHTNTLLDDALRGLPPVSDAPAMLRQRLEFNLEHAEYIVALLQYFMAVKQDFPAENGSFVPRRAYQHMYDVISRGVSEGCYQSADIDMDAKTATHLVNGFLLEYYPHVMTLAERRQLAERLARFIERALRPGGAV